MKLQGATCICNADYLKGHLGCLKHRMLRRGWMRLHEPQQKYGKNNNNDNGMKVAPHSLCTQDVEGHTLVVIIQHE
jgi:hypothetical protein